MFETVSMSIERAVARRHDDLIEYAEWQDFTYVQITPSEPGHADAADCWCEPAQFRRASGIRVIVHRRTH